MDDHVGRGFGGKNSKIPICSPLASPRHIPVGYDAIWTPRPTVNPVDFQTQTLTEGKPTAFTTIAVFGLGKVGHLAAELLTEAGFEVTGFDARPIADAPFPVREVDFTDPGASLEALGGQEAAVLPPLRFQQGRRFGGPCARHPLFRPHGRRSDDPAHPRARGRRERNHGAAMRFGAGICRDLADARGPRSSRADPTYARPPVDDDVVYVHVAAEGLADGRLGRREFVRAYYPIEIRFSGAYSRKSMARPPPSASPTRGEGIRSLEAGRRRRAGSLNGLLV